MDAEAPRLTDIASPFPPCSPPQAVSIRLVSDRDGKPKGFGYIEFEELDGLKEALVRSGGSLAGRNIRVGVAEPPKSGGPGGGFPSSAAEEASQWRRAGPLPPSEPAASSRPGMGGRERSGFGAPRGDGPSGFDNMEVGAGGRSGFGSRFQASPAGVGSGPGGFGAGAGPRDGPSSRMGPRPPVEPLEPTRGEVASDWRTGKPMEGPPSRRPGFGPAADGAPSSSGANRSPSMRGDATNVDEKYASQERMGFGSKFQATPPESPAMSNNTPRGPRGGFERKASGAAPLSAGPGDGADSWRSARAAPSPSAAPMSPPAPTERRKLDLKPRSAASATPATETPSSSSKSNPFGTAKPVDNAERERAIDERLRKEREQRAAEQEKAKAEKEKAMKDVPKGPRVDRDRTGPTSPPAGNATAAATGAETAASTEAAPAAPAAAAPAKAKSPPPTGAWGGGRKASGALAAGGAAPANGASTTNGGSDAAVAEATEGVDKASISA